MVTQLCRLALLAGLCMGAAVGVTARAEGTGAIAGVAMNLTDGKPLVGAVVQLTGAGLEAPRTVASEDAGKFAFDALPPGSYTLTVQLDGYEPFRRADLAVKDGETVRVGAWLAQKGSDAQEVVVTGSRIPRKDLTTAAPVTVIDREQIERSGQVGLGEFLQQLPQQVGAVNANMNNGNQGQVEFSLRGLSAKRTLVLVNGRRWVGGTGETQVDLNTVPLAAVERIEILKDGASAVYGSDAIAGVVNVILKKKFEGTQVSAQGGTSTRGDGESYELTASTGLTGERGSMFVSLGYQEQRPISATSRNFSRNGLYYDFETRSSGKASSFYTPSGSIVLRDAATVCADPGAIPNPVLRQACQQYQDVGADTFIYDKSTGQYRPLTEADRYNYQEHSYLVTPARRLQLFTVGNLQLGKEARAFYEFSFANRRSSRRFPASNEDMSVAADSPYNDFGTDVDVGKRTVEAGLRRYQEEVNTYRLAMGFDGELGAWARWLEGWHWELSYVLGRSVLRDTTDGQLRKYNLQASTGSSCGAPGSSCVPYDIMHGESTWDAAQRRYLTYTGTAHGDMQQHVLALNAGGNLFTLWANRPAGLAAGVELRRESGGYTPDPIAAADEASDGNQPPVSGGYTSREAYAELSIPLVSQRPLVEDLELTAALRNVNYSSFGSNTSYKLGWRWMPVRDVTLRGTWSTAFRAPGILELYGADAEAHRPGTDPCIAPATPAIDAQCRADPALHGNLPPDHGEAEVRTMEGGNTQLRPETATTFTVGVVLLPRWLKTLSFTVDYWDIGLKHTVDVIGAGTILSNCYTGDASGAVYCDKIHRDPATGQITQVDDRYTNLGETRTTGIDFAGRYALPTPVAGTFQLAADATYLIRYDQTLPTGIKVKSVGNYDRTLILPRWKWNAGLGWLYGPFGVSTEARYIGSLKECAGGCVNTPELSREVRSNLVFDLAGSYGLKGPLGVTTVMIGVRNVFDSAPPKIFTAAENNTDPTYDFMGRYVWARVTQTF